MKGVVWYHENRDQAIQLANEIAKSYQTWSNAGILKIRDRRGEYSIALNNGDVWMVFPEEEAKCMRCNVSYVSDMISQEYVDTVIKKCTSAFPYHGLTFWQEKTLAGSMADKRPSLKLKVD